MTGGQGVEPGEAQLARAVAAPGGPLLAGDDGEGGVDVADVVTVGEAVEVEEDGVELGPQVQPAVFVPHERRLDPPGGIDMAEVTRKRGHVVGGAGQLQHGFADNLAGG